MKFVGVPPARLHINEYFWYNFINITNTTMKNLYTIRSEVITSYFLKYISIGKIYHLTGHPQFSPTIDKIPRMINHHEK